MNSKYKLVYGPVLIATGSNLFVIIERMRERELLKSLEGSVTHPSSMFAWCSVQFHCKMSCDLNETWDDVQPQWSFSIYWQFFTVAEEILMI